MMNSHEAGRSEVSNDLEQRREEVLREIEEFNRERDHIRAMLGRIGGKRYSKTDMVMNILFLTSILTLFVIEITTHFLPPFISLEVSVLLVSIKIVWMIHSQHRFNHFQFWVLNTIEYRINSIDKELHRLRRRLEVATAPHG